MDADLVPGVDDLLGLLGERLDRMSRDEPRGLQVVLREQVQQSRCADLAGKEPTRDVVGRVLASVRAEPSGNGVDVDSESTEDLFRHVFVPFVSRAQRDLGRLSPAS